MRARGVVLLFFGVVSTGCHVALAGLIMESKKSNGAYREDAIATDLGPDHVRTLACLDIGLRIEPTYDSMLLDLDVGNRCAHAELFALNEMLIRCRDAKGEDCTVGLIDPRNEIRPVHIGALERGHERISLNVIGVPSEVCFELTGVVPDAPHTRSAPLCLVR